MDAFLVVKSMLLTGFDAPIEGVMYLDRPISEAELLEKLRLGRPLNIKLPLDPLLLLLKLFHNADETIKAFPVIIRKRSG